VVGLAWVFNHYTGKEQAIISTIIVSSGSYCLGHAFYYLFIYAKKSFGNINATMPEGRITLSNQTRAMYAVQLLDGTYSVFEISDSAEINLGDITSGPLD